MSGQGFSYFKPKLIELTIDKIEPISNEMRYLLKDTKEIDKILKIGADTKHVKLQTPVLKDVKEFSRLYFIKNIKFIEFICN